MRIGVVVTLLTIIGLSGCCCLSSGTGTVDLDGRCIRVDGSSTAYPISLRAAHAFERQRDDIRVEVIFSGSGAGLQKLCRGEIDICDASRPINEAEMKLCQRAKRDFVELPVAYDAICVVVNAENTWATSITVEELRRLWSPEAEGVVVRWNQIRAEWPAEPIRLCGPGRSSGTYDYFTKAIVGQEGRSRADFVVSEDDSELVDIVATDRCALGFFGLSYYLRNTKRLRALAIDDGDGTDGDGAEFPTVENVVSGVYQPLARPLFLYVSAKASERPEVRDFLAFCMCNAARLAEEAEYVPLSPELYAATRKRFESRQFGSAFGGHGAQVGLRMEDLLEMPIEMLMDIEVQ